MPGNGSRTEAEDQGAAISFSEVGTAKYKTRNSRRPADNQVAILLTEHLAWRAHQLAVEIADNDPNGVTYFLRRAATAQWRRTFMGEGQ